MRAESGAQGLKFGHFADGRVRLLADPCERAVLSAADAASRGGVAPEQISDWLKGVSSSGVAAAGDGSPPQ